MYGGTEPSSYTHTCAQCRHRRRNDNNLELFSIRRSSLLKPRGFPSAVYSAKLSRDRKAGAEVLDLPHEIVVSTLRVQRQLNSLASLNPQVPDVVVG